MRTATIENFLPLIDRTTKMVDVGHDRAHHGWLFARLAHLAPRQWRLTLGILLAGTALAFGLVAWQQASPPALTAATAGPTRPTAAQIQPAALKLAQVKTGPHTFDELQSAALSAVAERQHAVATLNTDLATSTAIDASTRQQLAKEFTSLIAGLTGLQQQLEAAQSEDPAFHQAVDDITAKFPVFSLVVPQVQGIEVVVVNGYVVALGNQTAGQLHDFIAAADAQHRSTDQLKAALATYQGKLQTIAQALSTANQAFLAIDGSGTSDNFGHRDAGVAALATASQAISDASSYLNQTIAPLVQQLKS